MLERFTLWRLLLILTGLLGFIYFGFTYTSIYPDHRVPNMIPRADAELQARDFLLKTGRLPADSLGLLTTKMRLRAEQPIIRYLQETQGLRAASQILATQISLYQWDIHWFRATDESISFNNSNDQPREEERYRAGIRMDEKGRIIQYRMDLPDESAALQSRTPEALAGMPLVSLAVGSVSLDSAKRALSEFLKLIPWFDNQMYPEQDHKDFAGGRYEFSYHRTRFNLEELVKITIRDGIVTEFDVSYKTGPEIALYRDSALRTFQQSADVFVIAALVLAFLILLFKRLRKGALNIKIGLFFGIVSFVVFGGMMAAVLYYEVWFAQAIVIFFGGSWWAVVTGLMVTVTASVAQDAWPEKFKTMEAITFGRVINRNFGIRLLDGMAWAGFLLGISSLILIFFDATAFSLDKDLNALNGPLTAVYLLTGPLWWSLLATFGLFLLPLSLIKLKTNRTVWLYATGTLIGILYPIMFSSASPWAPRLVIGAILGILTAHIMIRSDFLTLFTTIVVAMLLQSCWGFLYSGPPVQSTILWINIAALIVLAVLGIFNRDSGEDILDYVPEYVKEIEHKQRMEREFEIARTIQDNILARTSPKSTRFDIACMCVPAMEVGGDYYDFIHFDDPDRLGVVIGDVSGKGVSAAFYMTLVKGILQTQAPITHHSAKATLTRVNDIFCRQVERGKFISLVYAIFDFKSMTVSISRAGHNPVLIKQSQSDEPRIITPSGIAIGLSPGKVFEEEMEESQMPVRSGDVFVFYTDGFSESMNRHGEEFGDTRLHSSIQRYEDRSAQDLIDHIQSDVKAYVGDRPQHDDMTMIVVKIH